MVDTRFFTRRGPFSLASLAELTGATLADPAHASRQVSNVAPLDKATADDIGFLDNPRYLESFTRTQAGACFVHPKHADKAPTHTALLLTEAPYYAYALTASHFYPAEQATPGIHPSAVIAPDAVIGADCAIGPHAVIGRGAVLGARCSLGPGVVVGDYVTIGEGSSIGANSTLSHCLIGERVLIHRGAHIGQDGFGFAPSRQGLIKVPQLGRVVIEDQVEIGSGTCIDRGAGPDTVIGFGSKIDNLVQIGHNVQIGKFCIIVSQVGIAGSTRIGDGVMLGGQVGVAGHLSIGGGAKLAAQSGVHADIPANSAYGGSPAVPIQHWHRQTLALAKLVKPRSSQSS